MDFSKNFKKKLIYQNRVKSQFHSFEKNLDFNFQKCNSLPENTLDSNLIFLTAPPGSGKSYTAILEGLNLAKKGYISIIAFPNKNLMENNLTLAFKIQKENKDYNSVRIYTHSINDQLELQPMVQMFLMGKALILTVHAYFTPQGDFLKFSDLFCFTRLFSHRTHLFIDEFHQFIQNFEQIIPITHASIQNFENRQIITRSTQIRDVRDFLSYEISPPLIEYFRGVGGLQFFTNPKEIYDQKRGLNILNPSEFESLISDTGFVPQKTLLERQTFSHLLNSTEISNDKRLNLFFHGLELKISIGEPATYLGYYVEEKPLVFFSEKDMNIKFKKHFRKNFTKILNFNTIIRLMRGLDYEHVFRKISKSFYFSDSDPLDSSSKFEMYNKKISDAFFILSSFYLSEFEKLNLESELDFQKMQIFEEIKEFYSDFSEILAKNRYSFNQIYPQTADCALLINLCCSLDSSIVTTYPAGPEGIIHDLDSFKNEVRKFLEKSSKGSPTPSQEVSATTMSGDSISNPSFSSQTKSLNLNPENTVLVEQNESSLEKGNLTSDLRKVADLKFTHEAPFTSRIVLNNTYILQLLNELKSRTLLATATPPYHLMEKIHGEFSKNASFLSSVPFPNKLDEVVIFAAETDYFSNNSKKWKNFWKLFGQSFYKNVTCCEKAQKESEPIYGLMFPSDDTRAKFFVEYCLPLKSEYFTYIKGGFEQVELSRFIPEGSHKAKYSLRVSSIQSSLSVGLSLPNHKFILAATNIFKPSSFCRAFQGFEVFDAQFLSAYQNFIQAVGRNARKTQEELKNPEKKSIRVIFLSKSNVYPSMISSLIKEFEKAYKKVTFIPLGELEFQIASLSRGGKVFSNFQNVSKENEIQK